MTDFDGLKNRSNELFRVILSRHRMPGGPSSDDIARAFSDVSSSVDEVLGQLNGIRGSSFSSTQPVTRVSSEPVKWRQPIFRPWMVEGNRIVVKLEKELVVKKLITISSRFARFLKMDELFPVESVPSTPSSAAPSCRVGHSAIILTSSLTLPLARNIDSERVFCFHSNGLGASVDLKMPLIPENVKRVSHADKPNIAEPYTISFYRKIRHKKDRTTVIEAVEMRAIGSTTDDTFSEIFAEPMDRKTERLAYDERIFVAPGVIRLVTEFTVNSRDLDITQITRHIWKSDLVRVDPYLQTAREHPVDSIRVGSINDTSATVGSPPSANSPFSKMQTTDSRLLETVNAAMPAASSGSKVQEIVQRRMVLKTTDHDTKTATSPGNGK